MKQWMLLGLLFMAACGSEGEKDTALKGEAAETTAASSQVYDFGILAGQWTKKGQYAIVAESWQARDNGYWQGAVYRIEAGDSTLLEALQLEPRGDSSYAYVARVIGQNDEKSIPYLLSTYLRDSLFEFQNAGHDFPQRIVYRLPDTNTLEITLGILADSSKNKVFVFNRLLP
ncbi:MAG: hypothetical protein C0424_05425 [Sphingobacteriaceae bacterium]|nr:hypothetical protein [Sphingobacteriaceae bacterium]